MNVCEETGKVIYDRHSEAERTLSIISSRLNGRSGKAYRCKFCRGWHLTRAGRPTPAQRARRRAEEEREM